jgi:hypothetical protein
MRLQLFASCAVLSAAIAGAAAAQTPPPSAPPPPRVACRASAESLCPTEVKARDRTAVRACLIKNFDKVTPDCQAAMKAVKARGETPADSAPPPKP